MSSPNQPAGSLDKVEGGGNNKDDARPDEVKCDGCNKDDTPTEAPLIRQDVVIQVIKQEVKDHKMAKREKKALEKEEKKQVNIAAGMITPGRVPSEQVPPTCPRERPKTPLTPGPIKPHPSASSSSRPLP